MATFLVGILLITCLGYTTSENCVSERRFNKLEEIVREKFQELENENHELKEKLLALESKLDFYESQRKEYPVTTDAGVTTEETDIPVEEDFTDIRNRINRQIVSNTEPGKLKRQETAMVAFYAYLNGNQCYGEHQTFVYDVVETNDGSGYISHDGIFVVPVTGVYVFTVTVVPDFFRFLQAEIIVNGAVKGIIFADSNEIHDIHPASTSIVVHANAGVHVYVRRGKSSNCNVISDTNFARTTFAG